MPSLIPVDIDVTAGDSGILSNDPNYANVSWMLHFNGVGTTIVDDSIVANTVFSALSQTATTPKFGAGSLRLNNATVPSNTTRTPIVQGAAMDILSGTGDFTIDGWFWVDSATPNSSMYIMDYGGDQATFTFAHGLVISAGYIAGNLNFTVNTTIVNPVNATTWGGVSATVQAGGADAWHHFAVIRQSGIGKFYVDGVAQSGSATPWLNYQFPVGATYCAVGSTAAAAGACGTGKVDEVRVTKGLARWTANFTPPSVETSYIPIRRGYSDGSVTGVDAYGSSNPSPALIDTDPGVIISDYNTGTAAAPVYNFQVAITSSVDAAIFEDDLTSVSFTDKDSVLVNLLVANASFSTRDGGTTGIWAWAAPKEYLARLSTTTFTFIFEDSNVDFNCDCEVVSPYATLLSVRRKMLIRLGYPNQLVNPPPGLGTLIDQFLRDAQATIYRQLQRAALRTERFYRWTMVPGQRYYGLTANEGDCAATLDPYKVTWVGFEDLNRAWYQLDDGIPPEYYTRANINFGWPTRYEIRSCIEIFPAPQAAYTLWIKGDFGLDPLVDDTDRFTIDDEVVYMLALGNAKAHYGQKDAQLVLTQAGNMTRALVAGSHGTKRYVPRAQTASPLTPPRFLPLGDDQA